MERTRNHCMKAIFALLLMCSACPLGKSQSYQNEQYDPATIALPPGYYGYDPEAFAKGYQEELSKEQRTRQKDEFETTAQYQKRLQEADVQNPFMNKSYAFAAVPTNIKYDADAQTFTLEFIPSSDTHNIKFVSVLLKEGAKNLGDYQAENAFGATFTVTKSLYSTYQLWLTATESVGKCTISVTVPPAEARTLKPMITALVIVKAVPPVASVDRTFTDATFSEPHENTQERTTIFGKPLQIRFYNRTDGRILGSCPATMGL